ncbi:Nuclear pore complex protein, partial [Nymphaea thermarum]
TQCRGRILEYRDESQRLDQCARLFDTSVSNDAFEVDASRIVQELGGISTAMEREKVTLQELMSVAKGMIRNAEVAVRSFMMLQPRFVHLSASATSSSTSAQASGTATIPSAAAQPKSASIVPVFDFYSGYPKRPSPFLQQTVLRFEKRITECRQWIEELEHLLLSDTDDTNGSISNLAVLQSLPTVISNVHDFFVYVAAKVETLHQHIESMRTAYLTDQRLRGDENDPFLEADRRETAKREAAARRVHPTLHVHTLSQPSTQAAGLFSSSGASQVPVLQLPAGSSSSSSSGLSIFSTPTTSATSASSLSSFSFSTPSASAPTSSIFGAPGSSQQTSLFGTPSASSLFATPQTHSLFGTPFASTPATGSSPFSVTPAFGAATGSGASFGAGTVSVIILEEVVGNGRDGSR